MEPSRYVEKNPESRRASLANDVANKLVTFIQENNYTPGTRIPSEFELAEHFKVGRGTIREAVKLLISRNVLEIRPAKGTFVCENPGITMDPLGLQFVQDKKKMIRDLLDLRVVLVTLAIEPMVNVGTADVIELNDGWTVKTADGSLSAHYENTVALTSNGVLILTEVEKGF